MNHNQSPPILKAQQEEEPPEFKMKAPIILQVSEKHDHFLSLLMEKCNDYPEAKKPFVEDGEDWTIESLHEMNIVFGDLAKYYNLDTYKNSLQVISNKRMLDLYATVCMPPWNNHYSRAVEYLRNKKKYDAGHMGLAYETVLNTDPCISYLMEDNKPSMMALVIAHACYGHNSFFKGNYLFRDWSAADSIKSYLKYAYDYVAAAEKRIGVQEVNEFITSCKAVESHGVDRYHRHSPSIISADDVAHMKKLHDTDDDGTTTNHLFATIDAKSNKERLKRKRDKAKQPIDFSSGGHENLLYCLEKLSPAAQASERVKGSPWMIEIMRITRKVSQYFYPQMQTQLMNEGWATFWHYALAHVARKKGYLTEGQLIEILASHTGVVAQPAYNSRYYSGFNVYRLGWEMYLDIMFAADGPKSTEEQKYFDENQYAETFKDTTIYKDGKATCLLETDWLDTIHYVMKNHRDDDFVRQFLSPAIAKKFQMMSINDSSRKKFIEFSGSLIGCANKDAEFSNFKIIRQSLSKQYSLSARQPNINVVAFDPLGDQVFRLEHLAEDGVPLEERNAREVMKHINVLLRGPRSLGIEDYTGFHVELTSLDVRTPNCPRILDVFGKRSSDE
ncbi:MAG: stage V sporulation protein R [Alphaproteobacteria bacterium]|jgi:stage V sporulation protein R